MANPVRREHGTDSQLRSIIDTAHEAFVSMDAGGFITDWNAEAECTFGWTRDEAIGRVLAETIVPERYRADHMAGLQKFLDMGEGPVLGKRLELFGLHRDGHEFPIEITISAITDGEVPSFHAFLHDISGRRRSEQYLEAAHAVTRVLAEADSVPEAVPKLLEALGSSLDWEIGAWWALDSETGQLTCRELWLAPDFAAPRFEDLTRTSAFDPGVGLPGRVLETGAPAWVDDVVNDPNFPRAAAAAEGGLHGAICLPILSGAEVRGVIEFFTRQTRNYQEELARLMESLTAQVSRFYTILEEREGAMEKLASLALTDELTGLANRRAWDDGLERELARARREGFQLCLALFDLDHFKAFNDEFGHVAGDALLRKVADAWTLLLRATDLLARYGGEEFALAFPAWPMERALEVAERLRTGMPVGQTCSAGLVAWDRQETGPQLVARADRALYEAKRAGRDRTVIG